MTRVVRICTAFFLLTINGCSKTAGELGKYGYALEIDGIGDKVTIGDTLSLSVQLKQGGINHGVTADTIGVSANIVCGNNEAVVSEAEANTAGKVTFPALQLNSSWSGTCTVTVSATIDGQNITATHTFTITDTSDGSDRQASRPDSKEYTLSTGWSYAESGTTDSDGGSNRDNKNTTDINQPNDIQSFIAGTERTAAELEKDGEKNLDGHLFLQNCAKAMLIALDGEDLQATDTEGKLAISPSNSSWKYMVVGDVPNNCQLMYTASSLSAGRAIAKVVPTPVTSPVHGKITMIRRSEHNDKIIVTTGEVVDGSLYVTNDGSNWHAVSDVKWNDTTTTEIKWAAVGSDNYALLRIVSNDKSWWSLQTGGVHVSIVKSSDRGGKTFAIAGLGSNKKFNVKLTNDLCGVRVMQFHTAGNIIYLHAITTTAREMTSDSNGTISNLFPFNNPKQGCKLSFTIDDKEVTAVSTGATKSDLPPIKMRRSSRGGIYFKTYGKGRVEGAYLLNNGVGGSGHRSLLYKWLGGSVDSAVNWNSTAHKNIVLVILYTQDYRHVMYKEGS